MKIKRHLSLGFTLIELMIAMAIIGIIATITFVSYNGTKTRAYDISVQSDLERMEAIQTAYSLKHNVAGKIYYSVNGADSELDFTPSEGNIISVAVNTTDFCIRGYNPNGSKNSMDNALEKESSTGACATIDVINPPTQPVIEVANNYENVLATITTPSTCPAGTVQYSTRYRTNDGAWSNYTSWSTATTASQAGTVGVKYGYQARSRCYANEALISEATESTESSYVYYKYDALPIATSISGYWTTAPDGYLIENGAAVSRTTYADLFAVIGTTYGAGDGSTTFNLPDSRGRVAVNKSSTDAEFDVIGEKSGSKTTTVSTAEMPSHNHNGSAFASTGHAHSYSFTTSSLNYPDGRDSYTSVNEQAVASLWHVHVGSGWTNGPNSNASMSYQGGNGAHNNIQPSITKSFAIKYTKSTGADSMLPQGTSLSGYWTVAPTGYLVEDGSAVSRTTYADLFAAIGTAYGAGDGSTTFNLPDSRGRVAVNRNQSDAEFASVGQKYGEKAHALSISEIPYHDHASSFASTGHTHTYSGTTGAPNNQDSLESPNEQEGPNMSHFHTYSGTTSAPNSTAAVASEGGNGSHNNIQPSIVQLSVIKYTAPAGRLDELPKGTSISGYWATAPNGYLLEDGSAVSRATYADLFAAIGTTYGAGDGSTTFNLPDSRGRVAVNKNSSDAEFDVIGEKFGEKYHTLSMTETPSHNHGSSFASTGHGHTYSGTTGGANDQDSFGSPNEQAAANLGHGHPYSGTTSGPSGSASVSGQGGSGSHNTIQPSIVKMFAIRY